MRRRTATPINYSRNDRSIVEPQHELSLEDHSPRPNHHDRHQIGAVCRRHEIDDRRTACLSLEFGFEDECAGTISPSHGERRVRRSDEPSTVVGCPEQGGKARSGIETGPAQSVDRAVPADQSRRLAAADHGIVFDSHRHCTSLTERHDALGSQHPPFSLSDFRRNACEPPPIGPSQTAVLRWPRSFRPAQATGSPRAAKKPLAPLASARLAIRWLNRLRALSPLVNPKRAGSKQANGPSDVICVQNSRRRPIREFGGLTAMMAALIAPTDTPAIQSGLIPASASAS